MSRVRRMCPHVVVIEPDYATPRPGDVRESLADISLARELIGYEPSVELEQGQRTR